MLHAQHVALSAGAWLCASALLTGYGKADDAVTAYLRDGRVVTGAVDGKTDEQYLWLRRTSEHADVASGYRWDQVLEGRVEKQTLDVSELRTWAAARKQIGRRLAEIALAIPGEQRMMNAVPPPVPLPAVKTLVVDAELAQWDKDTQSDGLRIFVYPLDAQGQLVPIAGHIEFTLAVEREYARAVPYCKPGPEFVSSDRRTFRVRPEDFSNGPAFYELPFDRWHPDYETTLAPQALLHARLSVPGQGVFEASDAQVCVREFSRFRDQLQYYTPGRYMPLENPSRDGR